MQNDPAKRDLFVDESSSITVQCGSVTGEFNCTRWKIWLLIFPGAVLREDLLKLHLYCNTATLFQGSPGREAAKL